MQFLIIMTYVSFPIPIKPLIPALCEILPQVGTMNQEFLRTLPLSPNLCLIQGAGLCLNRRGVTVLAKRLVEHPVHAGDPPTEPLPLSYANGIGTQIQCREDWDTLLEMEQMGGKIRDTDDEYVGAEGRYDDK